ncbi:MAG: hypothetical protein JWR22_2181 [Herminiimonas sp.]|nr:hypothetical protein [Herminiimonas sp.]
MPKITVPNNDLLELVSMLADSLTAIAHVVSRTEEALATSTAPEGIDVERRNELLEARQALLLASLREIGAACLKSHIDVSEIMAKIDGN